MRWRIRAVFLAAVLLFAGCRKGKDSARQCLEIAESCQNVYENAEKEAAEHPAGTYRLTRAGTDAVEDWLMEQEHCVLDSREGYPAYLANSQGVYDFWSRVHSGEEAELTVVEVEGDGLTCWCLAFDGEAGSCDVVDVSLGAELKVTRQERRQVYDWELTRFGNFYFQILPADGHRVDYTVLRLTPPDETLWDLTRTYIAPVGYLATNLFLCDWSQEELGELSFNDAFEYLYELKHGTPPDPSGYRHTAEPYRVWIPAEVFEDTLLSYFDVSKEELRRGAMYDAETDSYPWRELQTYDYVEFRFLESEAEGCVENPDGTLTLTVRVRYPEKKEDCLFVHEVTIRPLADGGFRYVSNRVTQVSDLGMPSSRPRLDN